MNRNLKFFAAVLLAACVAGVLGQPTPDAGAGFLGGLGEIHVNNSFPDNPDDTAGWIGYAAYVAICAGILIIFGAFFTLFMWIFCCCYKCGHCHPDIPTNWRGRWILLYIIFYVALAVLGAICIAMVAAASTGINNSMEDVKVVADNIQSAPDDLADNIEVSKARLFSTINDTANQLASRGFTDIRAHLADLETTVNNTFITLLGINDTLHVIGAIYQQLLPDMVYLQSFGSALSDVPPNSTYHEPPGENEVAVQDAKTNFQNFQDQIDEARARIDDAETTFRDERDQQTQDLEAEVDDIVDTVLTTVRDFGDQIAGQFSREQIDNATNYYVELQNQVRQGVIIGLVAMNLVTYGLFFLGAFKKIKVLLKMPFYFASFTIWWLMLITALHFFIWIPVKDVCNNGLDYFRSPGPQAWVRNQFSGNDNNAPGTAPAPAPAGTPSTPAGAAQSAEGIFGNIVNAILTDPDVILQCSGEETFFQRLNLTILDQVPEISETVASFQDQFLNATSRLDANATAEMAIDSFSALSGNISQTQVRLEQYRNETSLNRGRLAGIIQQLVDPFPPFGLPSNQSDVVNSTLDYLNTLTTEFSGRFYTLENYTDDLGSPIYATNQTINSTQYLLDANYKAYTYVLTAKANITATVNHMNYTLGLLLIEVQFIDDQVQWIQNNVSYAVNGLQEMAGLQSQFIAFVIELVGHTVDEIYDILRLQNVGKCGWIGEFWNDGVQGDVCSSTNGSFGAAAFMLLFFCLLMFLSTPYLWYSKKALLDEIPKNIQDEDL